MITFSEIKGDRVIDVIAELIEPLTNIATDSSLQKLFARGNVPEGENVDDYLANRVKTSVPALLKTHKADIITILSSLNNVSYEEYANNLTLESFFSDTAALLNDKNFLSFFISFGRNGDDLSSGLSLEK